MANKPGVMREFEYTAVDAQNNKVSGEISAASINTAKGNLQIQGLSKISIHQKSTGIFSNQHRIKSEEITGFYRQVATMLVAGIPLVQALTIVEEGYPSSGIRKLCHKIRLEIESGKSFSVAIKGNPQYFDNLICSLVEAGELSGTLDVMMGRIASYKEKSDSLKNKIKKAMYYPIAVLGIAFIVTTILLIKVVPTFKDLFSSYGADLPAFTQFVLNISQALEQHGIIIFVGIFLFVLLTNRLYRKNKKFKELMQTISLKLPIFGNIIKKAIVARFARTLATTSAAGVPLIDSLEAVSIAANNIVYYHAIQNIKEGLAAGHQMGPTLKKTRVFPLLVSQMIGIGEESGALEDMLAKVATIYEEEVSNAIDGLTSLLEPLIMLILGVVVGGLVVAMYLPIFKMGSLM